MNPSTEPMDRFQVILAAAKRGHALQSGLAEAQVPLAHPEEKVTVTALREFLLPSVNEI